MNRTDRLYALVEELRAAPGARSAAWLAQRFEFSVRTLQRDVLALQEAGVPIWATPGPGGGYAIGPGHTLPPLNFTASEAAAVALAMARSAPMPFGGAARSHLHKVVAAMSAAGRGSAAVRTCTVNTPVSRVASQSADVESIQAERGRLVGRVRVDDRRPLPSEPVQRPSEGVVMGRKPSWGPAAPNVEWV
jgi:predicted DNA-binding transcriptional regulator YafY